MRVSVIIPSRLALNPASTLGNLYLDTATMSAKRQTADVEIEIVVGLDPRPPVPPRWRLPRRYRERVTSGPQLRATSGWWRKGQAAAVNRAVAASHLGGVVTSASLMVHGAAVAEAAAYANEHPSLSLGLHLDLGEWRHADGDWLPVYEVVDVTDGPAAADKVLGKLDQPEHSAHALVDGMLPVEMTGGDHRQVDRRERIAIPVRLRHDQREMRGEKGDIERPGLPVAVRLAQVGDGRRLRLVVDG